MRQEFQYQDKDLKVHYIPGRWDTVIISTTRLPGGGPVFAPSLQPSAHYTLLTTNINEWLEILHGYDKIFLISIKPTSRSSSHCYTPHQLWKANFAAVNQTKYLSGSTSELVQNGKQSTSRLEDPWEKERIKTKWEWVVLMLCLTASSEYNCILKHRGKTLIQPLPLLVFILS